MLEGGAVSDLPLPFVVLVVWLLLVAMAYGITWLYILWIKKRDLERYARFKSLDGKPNGEAGL